MVHWRRVRLRLVADEHHEDGDERGGEQQDQGGEGVDGDDEEQEDERRQGCQGELGQVLGVIGVEGIDTLGGGSHQLAAALPAGKGGTQVKEAAEQASAQVELEAAGEGGGGKIAAPDEQCAREDEDEEESQGRQHLIQGGAAEEDAADDEAGLESLEDGDDAASHAEQDGARQEQEGAAGLRREAGYTRRGSRLRGGGKRAVLEGWRWWDNHTRRGESREIQRASDLRAGAARADPGYSFCGNCFRKTISNEWDSPLAVGL